MQLNGRAGQLAANLLNRLERLTFPVSAECEAELRIRVCRYADELQASGEPPERVIVAVKQVAEEAGFEGSRPSAHSTDSRNEREKLVADLVTWCIDGYYREQALPLHSALRTFGGSAV